MFLLLGQLVYTSFAKVGFQALSSAAIPNEIRQIFIDQIVYQYWDSYNPPDVDYRAIYVYRLAADQTLFGWLYNDGVDDLGRSHVPYFVCYYFAGELHSEQLEAIFTCLTTGPAMIVDRQTMPDAIDSVVIKDYQQYQSERPGLDITSLLQTASNRATQQGKLFKLFTSNEGRLEFAEAPTKLVTHRAIDDQATLKISPSESPTSVEAYEQLLLTKIRNAPKPKRKFGNLKFAVGAASLVALMSIGFYLFRRVSFATLPVAPVTTTPTSVPPPLPALNTLRLDKTLTPNAGLIWSVILSPDGKTLISSTGDDAAIRIWDVDTGKLRSTLMGDMSIVRSLALTSDSKTLISGSADQTVRLWNFQTNQLMQTLQQDSPVWTVAVSPDQQTLVSGSEDGNLKVWDLPTGKLRYTIPAHQKRIMSTVFSPDGKTIATGSLDCTLKLWDAQTGKLLRTIMGHENTVRGLAFSPDGQTIASASWDSTIKLWNWRTGALIRTFTGHRDRAVSVKFSVDGQTLVSSGVDNTIKLWSVQTGKVLQTFTDHSDWVISLAIDANHVVSGSRDQTIRIWQIR